MQGEREVAGMGCGQVLEHLSDYIDGRLDTTVRTQIEAHLRGCRSCEQFGGTFSATILGLRLKLRSSDEAAATSFDGKLDKLLR